MSQFVLCFLGHLSRCCHRFLASTPDVKLIGLAQDMICNPIKVSEKQADMCLKSAHLSFVQMWRRRLHVRPGGNFRGA